MLKKGDTISILDFESKEVLETFEIERSDTIRELSNIGYSVVQVVDKEHKPLLPTYGEFDPFGRHVFWAVDVNQREYLAIPWAKAIKMWGFDLIRFS